jgi:hypothetical protein
LKGVRGKGSGGSGSHPLSQGRKWQLYSGLFVLLKQEIRLGREVLRQLLAEVLQFFRRLVWSDVRSHV